MFAREQISPSGEKNLIFAEEDGIILRERERKKVEYYGNTVPFNFHGPILIQAGCYLCSCVGVSFRSSLLLCTHPKNKR
ncbi:hypothetical protein VNO77_17940 [Canavalia gladiata]|uniref:Uncharacterized protein n=1 Tax=Canavalia gladiata TaxID=3824 RepID=A0AAN9LNP2_CANGL